MVKRVKLTKRAIDALQPPKTGDLFAWDTELKGFGVRVRPVSSSKPGLSAAYIIQYRTPRGQRRYSFAKVGTCTPDEARARALRLLAAVQDGGDPSAERYAEHEAQRVALTVTQLCDRYIEAARAGLVKTRFGEPKRASTLDIDEGRIARHINPLIGNKPAHRLTRGDVQRMVDAIAIGETAGVFKTKIRGKAVVSGGAGTAARVVELLGGIWTWAEKREFVSGANPARGIEKHRSKAKDRTLSPTELAKLGNAMRAYADRYPTASAALRLIALSGLRQGEAVMLKWAEIDATKTCLRLQETKTGRSTRPIGRPVSDLLTSVTKVSNEYVFGGSESKKRLAEIFDAAGLHDARSHDLRRTFASAAAELGYSDATIGELLGHARRGVTERHYVRRPDAVIVEAATKTAELIANRLDSKDASVVEFKPKEKGSSNSGVIQTVVYFPTSQF
ncbi:MAG TPA: site-specific integrase [Methylocella sp.]|jgi:integrase